MRFDWYQPTVAENPVRIVDELSRRLAPGGKVEEGRGRHNYWQSFTICDRAGDRVAMILCGGPNGDPNITASGPACDAFVPLVRELWPDHRVTRADVAEDMQGEGVYEALETVCRATAAGHGVKGLAFVPDDPADGRTYTMGSRASDVTARLYDKSAELRRRLPPERHSEVPDNVARLEVAVRPRKVWRELASKMRPEQFWGMSGWTAALAADALSLQVERITMQAGRETDHERSVRFLLRQYGPTLWRMYEDHGDWQAVGLQIGYELSKLRRVH